METFDAGRSARAPWDANASWSSAMEWEKGRDLRFPIPDTTRGSRTVMNGEGCKEDARGSHGSSPHKNGIKKIMTMVKPSHDGLYNLNKIISHS